MCKREGARESEREIQRVREIYKSESRGVRERERKRGTKKKKQLRQTDIERKRTESMLERERETT